MSANRKFQSYSKGEMRIRDSRPTHRYYNVKFGTHGTERYKYDANEVYNHALKTTKSLQAKDPTSKTFQVVLHFKDGAYRSGPRTETGAKPSIWDTTDSGDIGHGEIIGYHFNFDMAVDL